MGVGGLNVSMALEKLEKNEVHNEARAGTKKKVEQSEIGLTRVARSPPQCRGPISPRAINTNNRHISPPPNLDE